MNSLNDFAKSDTAEEMQVRLWQETIQEVSPLTMIPDWAKLGSKSSL